MSNSPTASAAGRPVSAAASALLERHGAALRRYLAHLPGADGPRIDAAVRQVLAEVPEGGELDDDPAVWVFMRARRALAGHGQRGDVLLAGDEDGAEELREEQDLRRAVHGAFARLTGKQQEALRLRFQFGFGTAEVARITGLSPGNAASLLQQGLGRIVQALPVEPGKPPHRVADARLFAYALDEMGAAERRAFLASAPDGKSVLETSEVIRRVARELAQILESGAPPPKRRRRKRGGAAWWRATLGGLVVTAGGLFWWWSGRDNIAGEDPATEAVAIGPDKPASVRLGASRLAVRTAHKRALRPGEAEWERKPFGHGGGQNERLVERPEGIDASVDAEGLPATGGERSDEPVLAENDKPELADSLPDRDDVIVAPLAGGVPEGGETSARFAPATAGSPVAPAKGTDMVRAATAFAGRVPEGHTREAPVPAVSPPLPGWGEVKRQLARREWPQAGRMGGGALLPTPPETRLPALGPDPIAALAEMCPSPFTPGKHIVRVMLRAKPAAPPARPPANLVLAIDVSDSMKAPNRLPLVQEGVRLLAERLRPEDRVAVVTYAAQAHEVRRGAPLGEGGDLRATLNALSAGGRTNGYEGLTLAYAAARRQLSLAGINVVILCTDGNFNLGETDEQALARLAAQEAAGGVRLSVFGFGRSDRNDLRLELLAQAGGGRSCYVNTRDEAERLLAEQVDGLLEPVARDIDWQVTFNPARVAAARPLGGMTEERVAELLPGRALTALYEVELRSAVSGAEAADWGAMQAEYRLAGQPSKDRLTHALNARAVSPVSASPGFRFAMAMAELRQILQSDRESAGPALARLEAWVVENLPDDGGGYRRDLLDTIALARRAAEL